MTHVLAFCVLLVVPLAPWIIAAAFVVFGRKG